MHIIKYIVYNYINKILLIYIDFSTVFAYIDVYRIIILAYFRLTLRSTVLQIFASDMV